MAAMHEDDSPDLREVGKILEDHLKVSHSMISSSSMPIVAIVISILTIATGLISSDIWSLIEGKKASC